MRHLHLKTERAPWLLLLFLTAYPLGAQTYVEENDGAGGLGMALRKLGVTASVLYVTAHPDDERNAVMVRLGRGEGVRTGLMTLTRGDGGQNEIGPELFQAIGVLRSEELLAVHRFDGAEQYFSRAIDFGYSFSVEETFRKWGRDEILKDLVRLIRRFRPLVMISMYPGGEGGGQHHQASARLALEAFRAAADPERYPEQIGEGLRPWQPLRLFQSFFRRRSLDGDEEMPPVYIVETGHYDPLLGETWAEFGTRARTRHRCQGMNALTRPGPARSHFLLGDSVVDTPAEGDDLFTGLDRGLEWVVRYDSALAGHVERLQARIEEANLAYRQSDYPAVARAVMLGLAAVREALEATSSEEALFLLGEEEKDFLRAAELSHFLHFDAWADETGDGTLIPGQEVEVDFSFYDRSGSLTEVRQTLLAPEGWSAARMDEERGGQFSFQVQVPPGAEATRQVYWRRFDPAVERYAVRQGFHGLVPFAPPPLRARVDFVSHGVEAHIERDVQYRWYGAEAGQERRMALKVVPELSVSIAPEVGVISHGSGQSQTLDVTVQNNRPGPGRARTRLQAPPGWSVEPGSRDLEFNFENQRVTVSFQATPPSSTAQGEYVFTAVAESAGKAFREGYQVISYPHIEVRHLYQPARARIKVLALKIPENLHVGYVMGVGDEVAAATEEVGAKVTMLEAADLASGDLSRFDAIVLGVRAYLARPDLVANNQRLLDYVYQGGHLVVQYNKYEFMRAEFAPYPVKLNRPADRITVEEAPVKVLLPEHPLFEKPNDITAGDWEGWVQERSTYMLGEWDGRFVPLIEMEDPVPYNSGKKLGGLVLAPYGDGTYLYVGLAFFRQLPAGVPGAYRLWANIISLGRVGD